MGEQQDHEPYWQLHTLPYAPFPTAEYPIDTPTEPIDRVAPDRAPRWPWSTAAVLATACICLVLWLLAAGSRREGMLPPGLAVSTAAAEHRNGYAPPVLTLPPAPAASAAAVIAHTTAPARVVHRSRPPAHRTAAPQPTVTAAPPTPPSPSAAPTPTVSLQGGPDGGTTTSP